MTGLIASITCRRAKSAFYNIGESEGDRYRQTNLTNENCRYLQHGPFNALNSELELSRARLKSPLYPGNAGLRSGSRYSQTGSRDVEGLEYDRDSDATYRDNHEETTIALLCPMTRTVDERAVSQHRRRFWAQRWSAYVGSAVVAARLA